MKQYTTPRQTAKLIELGVERPKGWEYPTMSSRYVMAVHIDKDPEFNYSIGELIDMLNGVDNVEINRYEGEWSIDINYTGTRNNELIDALYDMVIKLKEEGVI